jgi:PKHD-type hydroxylase
VLLSIPEVLSQEQLALCRRELEAAEWVDGRVTSGHQSSRVKHNTQVPEHHPIARELGEMIVAALEHVPLFISAALPRRVFPPLFNRYATGDTFGAHVDGAIRQVPGTPHRIRTDLSATLFLTPPDEYDGGELLVEDTYGTHAAKPSAGSMVLYPAGSLHRVNPVTRGIRLAAFFWIQSMVRDDAARRTLFELDSAIQTIAGDRGQADPAIIQLTGVYHNLLRRWAEL